MPYFMLKDVPKAQILAALKRFDQQWRHQANWDQMGEQRYVAINEKKIYPVKKLAALATGVDEANFTEDEAVKFLSRNQIQVKLKGYVSLGVDTTQPERRAVSRYYDSYLLKLQIERFKRDYESFRSKRLWDEEIEYKHTASKKLHIHIGKTILAGLIAKGDYETAKMEIKRTFQGNNLFNQFDPIPLLNAPPEKLAKRLYDLLYGEQPFAIRFNAWVDLLKASGGKTTVWPTATFYLALSDPEKYIYVKPTPFNDFLTGVKSGLKWEPETNLSFYTELLKLGKMLLQEPEIQELGAENLMDIQSFIWVLRNP